MAAAYPSHLMVDDSFERLELYLHCVRCNSPLTLFETLFTKEEAARFQLPKKGVFLVSQLFTQNVILKRDDEFWRRHRYHRCTPLEFVFCKGCGRRIGYSNPSDAYVALYKDKVC